MLYKRLNSIYVILACTGPLMLQNQGLAETPKPSKPAINAPSEPLGAVAGEVASVKGVAFIRADVKKGSSQLKPAKPGDIIRANDVINTSSGGSVKILLKDKTILDVGPSALLKMDKYVANHGDDREVEMNMLYGTIRGAVTQKIQGKGKFHLKTPTATMGVRGTEFIVQSEVKDLKEVAHGIQSPGQAMKADPKSQGTSAPASTAKTQITVLQGKVEVASKPAELDTKSAASKPSVVALGAGSQLTTTQADKAPPAPVKLETKQLQALSATAKVTDNTFSSAVTLDLGQKKGDSGVPAGFKAADFAAPGAASNLNFLTAAVAMPEMPTMTMGDLGISGSFSAANNNIFVSPSSTTTAPDPKAIERATHTIHIVITR